MIRLIIFDCDGTLVDSEPLSNQVFIKFANELGANLTEEEAVKNFVGTSLAYCMEYTSKTYDVKFPEGFVADYRVQSQLAFDTHLQPIAHAHELLTSIALPMCVASNGPLQTMRQNLATTNLLPFFGEHTYSAYVVNHWKPDPFLFLHAAKVFDTAPEECLVIEDSAAGLAAARAAGMQALAHVPADSLHVPKLNGYQRITSLLEVQNYIA